SRSSAAPYSTHSPTFFLSRSGHHRHLHSFPTDALPISAIEPSRVGHVVAGTGRRAPDRHTVDHRKPPGRSQLPSYGGSWDLPGGDRKSTRLNSSHVAISYAVFCLKKKKKTPHQSIR